MEYPFHHARRRLRLFFAYGFKNSPETSSPLAAQQSAELAGHGTTVGLVEARANYSARSSTRMTWTCDHGLPRRVVYPSSFGLSAMAC
jgi:hypothetical protein